MDVPRTVLVTGASTGLGLALARRLIQETDYRLILTARTESLPRFAAADIHETDGVWLRSLDVIDGAQRRRLVEEAEDRLGGVDILVNNAGISYRAVVEHVDDSERLAQMQVNFLAPMELTRLVLPGMRRRRWGRVLNVSSVGGMMAMPTMAVYSASKFALEGATEALWYEARPFNIWVSLIQPGFINSSSFQNVRFTGLSRGSSMSPGDPYHEHYRHMAPFIERLMRFTFATPDRVAAKVIRTMRRRRPPLRVPATLDATIFRLLRKLLPQQLYHEVLFRALPHVRSWGKVSPALLETPPGVAEAHRELKRIAAPRR